MARSRYATVALTMAAVATLAGSGAAAPVAHRAARLVTGKDIENGSITTKQVRNRSLTAKDLHEGVVRRGARGAAGAPGAAGAAGGGGPAGQPGATGASGQFADGATGAP